MRFGIKLLKFNLLFLVLARIGLAQDLSVGPLIQPYQGWFMTPGHEVEYSVYPARGKRVGDVLYFHGILARYQRHEAFFRDLSSRGLRVIALNFPFHGKTRTQAILNWLDPPVLRDFGRIAGELYHDVISRDQGLPRLPLVVAGWSMGGLLAIRMAQDPSIGKLPISGLILMAPGVRPQARFWSGINQREYDQESKMLLGEIITDRISRLKSFDSAWALPRLVDSVFDEARHAQMAVIPRGIRTWLMVAGDRDPVVHAGEVLAWAVDQRSRGARIEAHQNTSALHDVLSGGDTSEYVRARKLAADAALSMARASP